MLADLLKVPAGQGNMYDWVAVEATLGLELPGDYKDLVETFPEGLFQGVFRLVRPGVCGHSAEEYLGRSGAVLGQLRERRNLDPVAYPHAFYPAQGGLLPWAERPGGDLLYWATSDPNPNAWPIVIHDTKNKRWQFINARSVDVLLQLAKASGDPFFEYAESDGAPGAPKIGDFWSRAGIRHQRPTDHTVELASLLPEVQTLRALPWLRLAQETGTIFPRDYRDFIERFGAGVFCGISISSPGLSGDFGFEELLKRVRRAANGRDVTSAPIHPEWHGFVPWGQTEDGWFCGWAPSSDDPDEWGIVVALGSIESYTYLPQEGFSSFLVKHADPTYPVSNFTGRDPWSQDISFMPAVSLEEGP
jgi:hypothetical protein